MSTTPPANISSDTSPNSQTPSRHHDSQVHHSQSDAASSLPHHPAHIPPSIPTPDLTQGPSHHSRPEQDVSTRRPTKRKRRDRAANMTAERASSISESSSQSGMADNETEAERSQQSERSAPPVAAPPKKKRTRTLTTPHQSAVLHALLAKSRFPTTAMREEVGRQIGLSARKVQIWFQNQRQKARRPQSESAPLTRPPQFGPFPIMGPTGPSPPSYPSPVAAGATAEILQPGPSNSRSVVTESRGSFDSNPPLSGPGIPGWSSHQHASASVEEWEPPRRAPTSPESVVGNSQQLHPPRLSEGISPQISRGSTRGLPPPPAQVQEGDTSPQFSRILPPINLSALKPRSSTDRYVSATSSFPPQAQLTPSVNIVQRHDSTSHPAIEQGSSAALNIPPPFALQPRPQWDPQTFTPYTRPEFASWANASRPSHSARANFSAVGAHDRLTHNVSPDLSRVRHFYPSSGEPPRGSHPPDPLHHIISPSPQRLSTSASSRASLSGEGHARSDDEAGEH